MKSIIFVKAKYKIIVNLTSLNIIAIQIKLITMIWMIDSINAKKNYKKKSWYGEHNVMEMIINIIGLAIISGT